MYGSSVGENVSLDLCDVEINTKLLDNLALSSNKTGDVFRSPTTEDFIFNVFDLLLIQADLFNGLYPVVDDCWDAGDYVITHYRTKISEADSLKPYVMNVVYNFGLVFDALRDYWLFIATDPRSEDDGVFNAGDSLGQAIYYLIDPNLELYESQAELIDEEVDEATSDVTV